KQGGRDERGAGKGEAAPDAVYYLHGDEYVLKDEAVQALVDRVLDAGARDFNFDQRSAGELDAEAFHSLVNTPPLLAAVRVVVLRGVENVRKTSKVRQALVRYLQAPNPTTLLILVQGAGEPPDAELARSATTVAIEPLPAPRVHKWVAHRARQLQLTLEPDAAELLVQTVGNDLGALAGELEKLAAVAAGRTGDGRATRDDVAALVGARPGETLQDLVDAALERPAPAAGRPHRPAWRAPCSASSAPRGRSAWGAGSRRRRGGPAGPRIGARGRSARPCVSLSTPIVPSSRPRSPTSGEFWCSWCSRWACSSRRLRDRRSADRRTGGRSCGSAAAVRLSGDSPASASESFRVRAHRLRASRGAPRRADPPGLRPRDDASAARESVTAGFALPRGAVHRGAHRPRRRGRGHQSAARGRGVRPLGVGGLGAGAPHAALLRAGRSGGDRAGGGAAAPRLPRFAAQATRRLLGSPGIFRPERRRARLQLDP